MKFKVGDKVRLLEDNSFYKKGTLVDIFEVDEADCELPYMVGYGLSCSWVSESDLEPIGEDKLDPYTKPLSRIDHYVLAFIKSGKKVLTLEQYIDKAKEIIKLVDDEGI